MVMRLYCKICNTHYTAKDLTDAMNKAISEHSHGEKPPYGVEYSIDKLKRVARNQKVLVGNKRFNV
jgi:hypothetical protein